MKKSRSILCVLGFAVLGLCFTTANAADEQADKPTGKRKAGQADGDRKAAFLKRFDKNGDGQLDEQEREAARKARQERQGQGGNPGEFFARIMERIDTNKDGQLNAQEIAAARKAMEERRKNFAGKKKDNQEGDGNKKGKGIGPGRGRGDLMSHLLENFDKNKDGSLDKQELTAAQTAFKNRKGTDGKSRKGRPGDGKKKQGADGKGRKRPEKKQSDN